MGMSRELRLYNRDVMTAVLVAHQRHRSDACLCGWAELGKSHAEHVATEYEKFIDTVATITTIIAIPAHIVEQGDATQNAFIKFELGKIKAHLNSRGEDFFGQIDLLIRDEDMSLGRTGKPPAYLEIVYSARPV